MLRGGDGGGWGCGWKTERNQNKLGPTNLLHDREINKTNDNDCFFAHQLGKMTRMSILSPLTWSTGSTGARTLIRPPDKAVCAVSETKNFICILSVRRPGFSLCLSLCESTSLSLLLPLSLSSSL